MSVRRTNLTKHSPIRLSTNLIVHQMNHTTTTEMFLNCRSLVALEFDLIICNVSIVKFLL